MRQRTRLPLVARTFYFRPVEVRQLIEAAKKLGRHGHRDAVLIMMAYRHALRVGELVNLAWDQVNFSEGKLHVNRLKHGDASIHYLEGDEIRALRKLQRDYPDSRGLSSIRAETNAKPESLFG